MPVIGGFKINAIARQIKNLKNMEIHVGFYKKAVYPTGEQVARVAYENEYGIGKPERPFFRLANIKTIKFINSQITKIQHLPRARLINSPQFAELMGQEAKNNVHRSIVELRDPENSPYTIAKKGSSNPLIDTGLMNQSVSFEIKWRNRKMSKKI